MGAAKPGGISAADSSVQRVADQLASVALQLQTGKKADPTLQTARPKHRYVDRIHASTAVIAAHPNPVCCCYCRVASKVVSYTDAGASLQVSGDGEGNDSDSHSVTQSVGGERQRSKSRPVHWTDEMVCIT